VVLKESDTQFYVGTRVIFTPEEWSAGVADFEATMAAGLANRQRFYFKWASRFGWAEEMGWKTSSDVHLIHAEPYIRCAGEYQAEVVALPDGTMQMADTGDIEHGPKGAITLFKTPGTFRFTPVLRKWLNDMAGKLIGAGYKGAAMDVEFMRVAGEEESYQLVEINSRYSYMGNYIHFGNSGAHISAKHKARHGALEVRNLINRTRLSLGAVPMTLPSRDERGIAKLAAMIYTEQRGDLDSIIDQKALHAMVDDQTIDAFAPKPVYLSGKVTEADLRLHNGWAKIGVILMTMEDDLDVINAELNRVCVKLFYGSNRGFLPVEVVDEDGPGETGLHPNILELSFEQRQKTKAVLATPAQGESVVGGPGAEAQASLGAPGACGCIVC